MRFDHLLTAMEMLNILYTNCEGHTKGKAILFHCVHFYYH